MIAVDAADFWNAWAEGDRVPLPRPSPVEEWPALLARLAASLDAFGVAYVWLVRGFHGAPVQFRLMMTQNMIVALDEDRRARYSVLMPHGTPWELPASHVRVYRKAPSRKEAA